MIDIPARHMIRIKNLVKIRMGRRVLDNINLCLQRGTALGLLGVNGAGKTTLVEILNGLTSFDEGEITVFGLPLRKNLPEIRARSALIPQSPALYGRLSVLENLRFFAGLRKISGTRLARHLEYAITVNRLEPLLDKKAATLSGGEQQRLNIAIGLLNDPELLYLDEPTAGLDPEMRNDILDSIATLVAEGRTIVYTSHYLAEIEKICNEVAILHHGTIIRHGPLTKLLAHANTNRAEAIIELVHALPPHPCDFEKEPVCAQRIAPSTLVLANADAYRTGLLLTLLEQENIAVDRISYSTICLETLFINLTSQETGNA